MTITVKCACGKAWKFRDEDAGKKGRCRGCGSLLEISQPPPADNPPKGFFDGVDTVDVDTTPTIKPEENDGCVNVNAVNDPAEEVSPAFHALMRLGWTPEKDAASPPQPSSASSKLVPCKVCGKDVSTNSSTCPHCGESAPGLHIKCPKCGSMNIATGQKGFGLGKSAIGLALLGPVGLLGGMIGRKRAELVCQACGKKWKPEARSRKPRSRST